MMAPSDDVFCEIELSRHQDLVGSVTDFVVDASGRIFANAELCGRLEVATHELVDNAVKYSIDGRSSVALRMKRIADRICVSIQTKNRADGATRAEIAELFAEMRAAVSRSAFYQMLLRRTAQRIEGSGLGLGRIHAEMEMDLSYEFEGDVVHLRAETNVPTTEKEEP